MARKGYFSEDHICHHFIQITQSVEPTESWFFVGKCSIRRNSLSPEVFITCQNSMSTTPNMNNTKWAALSQPWPMRIYNVGLSKWQHEINVVFGDLNDRFRMSINHAISGMVTGYSKLKKFSELTRVHYLQCQITGIKCRFQEKEKLLSPFQNQSRCM